MRHIKNIKFKKFFGILFVFLISSVLLSGYCLAQRQLEIIYPEIGTNVAAPTTVQTPLPDYIRYVFNFAIVISGFIAFASFI